MLEKAMAKWATLPEEARSPKEDLDADAAKKSRPESRFPSTGIAITEYTRDLPRDDAPKDWRGEAWNIDHLWITAKEAKGLVPIEREVGARRLVPSPIARRIAVFHLVDFVRGQTGPNPADAVEKAQITSEVTSIDGDVVHVGLEGSFRVAAKGRWLVRSDKPLEDQERGVEGTLLGTAAYDAAAQKLVSLDFVVLGKRWGGTQYNGRGDDLAPSPVGFAFRLAGDTPADRVPPQFVWSDYWAK